MLKNIILLIVGCLLSVSQIDAQDQQDLSALVSLKNMHKVDNGIYRSSQPNNVEFEQLEAAGIKEVLNLRRLNSDNEEAEGTTLTLHHIKMRAGGLNEEHLLKALKIIASRDGDILIHCHHGSDRTGAVVAMYRIIYQDWTKEEAIEEMKKGGFGFHGIYRNIPRLINKIDIENFKEKLSEIE